MTRKLRLFILLLSLVSLITNCYADDYTDRFCVVPIKNVPSYTSLLKSRLVESRWQLPGIEQPLYVNNLNQRATKFGTWTINEHREFVPYNHLAPTHPWDEYIEEPWSGRVVFNRNIAENNVLTLEQGKTLFKKIDQSVLKGRIYYRGLFTLPSLQETIVFTRSGIPFLVGTNSLKPWPTHQKIKQQGISFLEVGLGGLKPIYDASALDGFIVVSDERELFLYSDNKLEKLKIGKIDRIQKSVNLINKKMFVLVTRAAIHVVQRSDNGKIEVKKYIAGENLDYKHLKSMGQFLWYDSSISRWVNLTNKGFKPISVQSGVSIPQKISIKEIPNLKLALLDTQNEIYQYDGTRFINVFTYPNSQKHYSEIFSLPSIEKTLLLMNDNRLFSFEKNQPLIRVATTVELSSAFQTSIIDWPNAKSAILLNDSGSYTVDKDLAIKKIHGGDVFTRYFSTAEYIGQNDSAGELFLSNRRGLFAVIDKNLSGPEVCDHYDTLKSKTPMVELCLNPVKQSKIEDTGMFLGDWKPSSNGEGVLFNAFKGVYYIDKSNTTLNISPKHDGSQATDEGFVPLWWSTESRNYIEWEELKRIFIKPFKRSKEERIWLFNRQFEASNIIRTSTIFDINDETIVAATTDGSYITQTTGKLQKLAGNNLVGKNLLRAYHHYWIQTLARHPNGYDVVLGNGKGLFFIDVKKKTIELISDDVYDLMGSISRIQNIDKYRKLLIEASNGDFLVDEYNNITKIKNIDGFSKMKVFHGGNNIYITKGSKHKDRIFEVQLNCIVGSNDGLRH